MQGKLRIGLAEKTVLISLAKCFSKDVNDEVDDETENREDTDKAVETVKQVFCELPIYDDLIRALVEANGTKTIREHCHVKVGETLFRTLVSDADCIGWCTFEADVGKAHERDLCDF